MALANAESRPVLRAYYTIAGLYTLAASVIWGVNTLFLLDAGLDFFEVFIANAAFSVGTVLFEIPTGVVADTLGRRVSFLLSVTVLAATTIGYLALAQIEAGLIPFAIVSVLLGLGFTFYTGAVEAWLVDALEARGYEGNLDRVFARGQMVSGAAMLSGTVAGGFLGQIDLAVPFVIRTVLLVLLFVLAFNRMHDIGFTAHRPSLEELPGAMMDNARAGVRFGWRQRDLRLLMLASAVQTGFFFWAFYAQQPYFLELLGRDAIWVAGVVSALVALSMMVGNGLVEWFTRFCGRRTTLLVAAAGAQTVAAVIVGLTTSFWVAVPVFLVITAAVGVAMPVRQAYIHNRIPSEQRATVVSFDAMVAGVGGAGGQAGLGALGRSQSVGFAFVTGGIATAVALPLLWAVRRMGDEADRFVGSEAAESGGCPTVGIPAISAIDDRAPEPV